MCTSTAPPWLLDLASTHRSEPDHGPSCQGTLRLIDQAARRRGARSVVRGESVSLARPVVAGRSVRSDDDRPSAVVEAFTRHTATGHWVGSERVELDSHGVDNTHLDGLHHTGIDGVWHTGEPAGSPVEPGQALVGSDSGIVTRAVLLDLTSADDGWVSGEVTAIALDRALGATGLTLEAGDAVLLYMGRDAYEEAGHRYGPVADHPDGRPGLGRSGAEWLVDRCVSVLGWDFLDAHGEGLDVLPAHAMTWAVGLILIDNCELGSAARSMREAGVSEGLLCVAPPRLRGVTGSLVNPVLVH